MPIHICMVNRLTSSSMDSLTAKMKLLNMYSQSKHCDELITDTGREEEELQSGCSCCIGCLLSREEGLTVRKRENERELGDEGSALVGRKGMPLSCVFR